METQGHDINIQTRVGILFSSARPSANQDYTLLLILCPMFIDHVKQVPPDIRHNISWAIWNSFFVELSKSSYDDGSTD